MHKLTVAVIGATGKIGSVLTQNLIEKGCKLKLLVRTPEKILQPSQVTIVKGDARNVTAVQELVNGCDVLINCIGQPKGEAPLFSLVAENILNALNYEGVKRYIVIAGLGLETLNDKKRFATKVLTRMMHLLFPAIMNDKKREYKLITGSSLDWTFIRIPKVVQTSQVKPVSTSLYDCLTMKITIGGLVGFIISQLESTDLIKKAPFVFNQPAELYVFKEV